MTEQEMEEKIRALQEKMAKIQDVQDIEKLQRAYGYYLDNRLWDEIVDLFSEDAESIEISNAGVYLGKKGVERFFKEVLGKRALPEMPGSLTIHMQLQGIVNLGPALDAAKGRWQCVMFLATSVDGQLRPLFGHGVYEVEYVKRDGVWKFGKMHFYLTFRTPLDEGWVKTPVAISMKSPNKSNDLPTFYDSPTTVYKPYPEKFIVPFHYKNPVTGK